jgi:KAP-like P-loop domain-containing protein
MAMTASLKVNSAPIPVVADIPTASPGLGFPEYVEALADAIRGGEPAQFTIGLYGAWGSGKSSLLKAVDRNLSADGSNVLPVLFDAWRHERSDYVVVPLLYQISRAAQESGDHKLTEHLRRALHALVASINFSVSGFGFEGRKLVEDLDKAEPSPLDAAFSKPFEELRSLPATLDGKRVAVLVDDLDRCSPDKVVALLEAINLVMDIDGFIFVLALDYEVLVKAVTTKYPHVSGHEFIEKMVQLPFRVPPLTITAGDFLADLIPDWAPRSAALPAEFSKAIPDVADLGLRSNPRQIKRLINSFLLIQRVVERRGLELDHSLLAAMIGMQLRWPDEYDDIQDAVLAEDPDPLVAVKGTEDHALSRYAQRFFAGSPNRDMLRQILQLTAVVAAERPRVAEDRPVREVQRQMRDEFIAGLIQRGFALNKQSGRAWYNPQRENLRVVLTVTGFRIERPNKESSGRPWQLAWSMDYRRYEAGLAWLDAPGDPRPPKGANVGV